MNTFLRSLTTTQQIGALFLVLFGVLALVSLWAFVRSLREARNEGRDDPARKMAARRLRGLLQTSWAMATVFWVGWALGETMAVTFVIGNTNFLDGVSLFAPGNSITSALANEFAEASPGLHTAALMELGLILFFITFVVLACSKLLLARLKKSEGAKS